MSKKNAERNNPLLKKIDKLIGCPLVFILGFFHKEKARPQKYQKIAVIKTAAVGDTIILSAMLDEIKCSYPNAQVTVVCSKNNAAMVKALSDIGQVEVFAMKNPIQSLKRVRDLGHFDLVMDFGPWPRINAIISWAINANYKVGFKRGDTYRHYIYDAKVEHSDRLHEIENYRNILRGAGIAVKNLLPDLCTNERIIEDSYIVFHLFPGGAMDLQRRWDNEKWIKLAKELYQRYDTTILLSGGKADWEEAQELCEQIERQGIPVKNIAAQYSLQDMAGILQYAKLVVSVNTGIMHYAAAVGVPLIALHGATSEVRWGPLSDKAIVVKSDEPCQPCISLGFESKCTEPVCMKNITVEMVINAVGKVMEK